MKENSMSNFGLSCDVCNRENVGITWVNGMKFCAKCYQETFGNKNMTENLNNMYDAYLKILNEKDQRIAELEEQSCAKLITIYSCQFCLRNAKSSTSLEK